MGLRSPLVTLAATAVGLVALLVVNSTQTGSPTAAETPPATSAPPTSAPPSAPPTQPPTSAPTTEPPAQDLNAVYAGRTRGQEAAVAVAIKGARAVAYICDGRQLEAWLTGTVTNGRLDLKSKTGEVLTAIVNNNLVAGTLTLDGRTLRFTVPPAGPPAGLYRGKNSKSTIGWIILPDGSQVGVDNDGTPAPAPQLDPATGEATVGGAPVTAQSITGDETF